MIDTRRSRSRSGPCSMNRVNRARPLDAEVIPEAGSATRRRRPRAARRPGRDHRDRSSSRPTSHRIRTCACDRRAPTWSNSRTSRHDRPREAKWCHNRSRLAIMTGGRSPGTSRTSTGPGRPAARTGGRRARGRTSPWPASSAFVREAADHGGTRHRDEPEIEHRTRRRSARPGHRRPGWNDAIRVPSQGGMAVGHRRQRPGLAAARPIAERPGSGSSSTARQVRSSQGSEAFVSSSSPGDGKGAIPARARSAADAARGVPPAASPMAERSTAMHGRRRSAGRPARQWRSA